MSVRAVLFAIEETLVPEQTHERWQWAWRPQGPVLPERHVRAAVKRGLHAWDRRRWSGLTGAAPAVDEAAFREHLRSTLLEIAGHGLPEPEIQAVVDRFLRAPVLRPPRLEVAPTLERLRGRGIRIGAIGARPGPSGPEALKRGGLASLIDVVAGTDPAAPWPPSGAAFRSAAEAIGVPPKESAFVGGLYWSEVRAAARVGYRSVLLDPEGWWPRVEGERLTRLSGLLELLEAAERGPAPPAPAVDGPGTPPGALP